MQELKAYNPELLKRKRLIALNKIDLGEPPPVGVDVPTFPISAKEKKSLDPLLDHIFLTFKKEVMYGKEEENRKD